MTHVDFTFRDSQNLDEEILKALCSLGIEKDQKRIEFENTLRYGLAEAEEGGNEESSNMWRNMLLAHEASVSPVDKEIRQISIAVSQLLNVAGIGEYDAEFVVSFEFGEDGNTHISVNRGAGDKHISSTPQGDITTLTPDAAIVSSVGGEITINEETS